MVGGRASVTGLDLIAPNLTVNQIALDVQQQDPDAHVLRLRNAAGTEVLVSEQDGDLVVSGQVLAAGGVPSDPIATVNNDEADTLLQGELVQIVSTGIRRVARALGTSLATVDVAGAVRPAAGIAAGAAGTVWYAGLATVRLVAGLAGVDEGQRVYVSAVTAGRGTTTAPDTTGQYAAEIGVITDATTYDGGAGLLVQVMLDKKAPVRA